jgi:hypothetical protein
MGLQSCGRKTLTETLRRTFYYVVLVRERTVPTERPPLLGEVSANFFADRRCYVVRAADPHGLILVFIDRSRYYVFQVAPQLHSRG